MSNKIKNLFKKKKKDFLIKLLKLSKKEREKY